MGSQRVRHDWATELNWCGRINDLQKCPPGSGSLEGPQAWGLKAGDAFPLPCPAPNGIFSSALWGFSVWRHSMVVNLGAFVSVLFMALCWSCILPPWLLTFLPFKIFTIFKNLAWAKNKAKCLTFVMQSNSHNPRHGSLGPPSHSENCPEELRGLDL